MPHCVLCCCDYRRLGLPPATALLAHQPHRLSLTGQIASCTGPPTPNILPAAWRANLRAICRAPLAMHRCTASIAFPLTEEHEMKLYLLPGACSMASNIALREAGIKFDLAKVDRRTKHVDGVEFATINPKGYVPALRLDDGQVLTENVAVLQYIADLNPAAKLLGPSGSLERYRALEWLSFINSEIHKSFSPLFSPEATEETKTYSRKNLLKRLAYVEGALGDNKYLMGDQFTVADAYLFTALTWGARVAVDIGPKLKSYVDRVRERPHVVEAMTAEGLIRK